MAVKTCNDIIYTLTIVSDVGTDSLSICAAYTGIAQIWYARGEPAPALQHFLGRIHCKKNLGEADGLDYVITRYCYYVFKVR